MVTVTLPDDGDSVVDVKLPRATGSAATISVGTVVTGSPLSIVNSGTSSAAVFDFVIPSGGGGVSPPFAISDTTGLQSALDGKQPLDADLTSIAALTTTSYGRGLLTLVDVATLKTSLTLVKGDVGLGSVDNTSDANKPVSTATQTALNLKANLASPTFTGTVSGITAAMVGLGNVTNTSDANKPVSTAQQAALDLKAPLLDTYVTVSATTYTFLATDLGKIVLFTNASGCTATVPNNTVAGFNCIAQQDAGAGQVIIVAASGAAIMAYPANGFKTPGANGQISVAVKSNTGTAAQIVVGGGVV